MARIPLALTFSVKAHAATAGSSPFESRTRNFQSPRFSLRPFMRAYFRAWAALEGASQGARRGELLGFQGLRGLRGDSPPVTLLTVGYSHCAAVSQARN